MVGFEDKLFATEVVAELEESEVERIGLLLVSVPVDCSTRVLFRSKGNSLMSDSADGVGVELKKDSTAPTAQSEESERHGEFVNLRKLYYSVVIESNFRVKSLLLDYLVSAVVIKRIFFFRKQFC